ncbi:hypothetical protein [Alkalihalobacillus trypoxylicola]|nr:hypothetical protein [Alkalihalobacillus trypoxylicola]GAF65771.1 hypothetical protein BTS2_2670 [Bacillus sp. TS-2]
MNTDKKMDLLVEYFEKKYEKTLKKVEKEQIKLFLLQEKVIKD